MNHCPFDFRKLSAIKKILNDSSYRVRPINEPIPNIIKENIFGEIFKDLVRMRDDREREEIKTALTDTLSTFSAEYINDVTERVITVLAPRCYSSKAVNDFLLAVPICVIGHFLGFIPTQWRQLVEDSQCFSQAIMVSQLPESKIADDRIIVIQRLYSQIKDQKGILFVQLQESLSDKYVEDLHVVIANLMGLLFQVSDGTTGLLGLTLIEYQKSHQIHDNKKYDFSELINQVLSVTPPIKNSKRFTMNNEQLEMITFPLQAEDGVLPFGDGKHHCPGEHIAKAITYTVLNFIDHNNIDTTIFSQFHWKESSNANIPLFYD